MCYVLSADVCVDADEGSGLDYSIHILVNSTMYSVCSMNEMSLPVKPCARLGASTMPKILAERSLHALSLSTALRFRAQFKGI